ncbi:MAG: hypothetical protein LBH92_03385 [Bacteroidales bacterium]|jgi:hypothetical protein|nr:hypothetical protein [Bacteroidales bacterium]
MQRILFFILTLSTGLVFLTGCEPVDNFEGIARDRYIGAWNCTDKNLKATYSVEIEADPANMSQVLIKNFGNIGQHIYATGLVSESRIFVQDQKVGTLWCEGEGTLNANTISWSKYNIGEEDKTATFTRR